MNPRFTGITGLRALMGFNEIEACIREWLNIPAARFPLSINKNKFGVRQVADKCLDLTMNKAVSNLSNRIHNASMERRKVLLITGAEGYPGQALVCELKKDSINTIVALGRGRDGLEAIYPDSAIKKLTAAELWKGDLPFGILDRIVHCAFSRPHRSQKEIADSLSFTSKLFQQASLNSVPAILNISSQSIYGSAYSPPWDEDMIASPDSPYAMAKFASELLAKSQNTLSSSSVFCSLRLSTLTGGQSGLKQIDLLARFVNDALAGKPLQILGGKQMVERLDVRDAANAIVTLLGTPPQLWEKCYNVGPGIQYTVLELAERTVSAVSKYSGKPKVKIEITKSDAQSRLGLSTIKFQKSTNWSPKHSMDKTIDSLIHFYSREGVQVAR